MLFTQALPVLTAFLASFHTSLARPADIDTANVVHKYSLDVLGAVPSGVIKRQSLFQLINAQSRVIASKIAEFGPEAEIGTDAYVVSNNDTFTPDTAVTVTVSMQSERGPPLTWSLLAYVFSLRERDFAGAKLPESGDYENFVAFLYDGRKDVGTVSFLRHDDAMSEPVESHQMASQMTQTS